MPRVCAVVQARLGSTRLPSKVLKALGEETVIDRLLRHLKMVPELDQVVLAVPYDDEALAMHAYANHCGFTLGPEDDVLARYQKAAEEWDADVIVRVTSDCPLTDPRLVSDAVKAYQSYKRQKVAYYWRQGYLHGMGDIEVFSRTALDWAAIREKNARRREHVFHAVMLAGIDLGESVFSPWCPDAYRRTGYRLTLDEPDDLKAIRAVVDELGEKANDVMAVTALLDARPDIRAINAHVQQVPA